MPKITLNNTILTKYDHNTVEQVFTYMQSIAEENENFNRDISHIMKGVYELSQDTIKTPSPEDRNKRLMQAKEFFCYLGNFPVKECSDAVTNEVLTIFISGALADADKAKALKEFVAALKNKETIELSLLATFYFTLKLEFQRMEKIPNQSEPEKAMIEKLMLALEPLVLPPERRDLQRLYYFCETKFEYKPNVDIQSDKSIVEGVRGELFVSREYFARYLQAFKKINALKKDIVAQYYASMEEYWKRDNQAMQRNMPFCSCYTINVDNYSRYTFDVLYRMAYLYEELRKEEKEDLDWIKLQEETEKLIAESKNLSAQKMAEQKRAIKAVKKEQEMVLVVNKEFSTLEEQLHRLNKDHLETLANLYDSKVNIKFSEFSTAITALGGKVEIFQGSKMHIFLTKLFFVLPEVVGGFHVPHKDTIPLHFIQRRLACKALERAGFTKDLICKIFEAKFGSNKKEKSTFTPLHATVLNQAAKLPQVKSEKIEEKKKKVKGSKK